MSESSVPDMPDEPSEPDVSDEPTVPDKPTLLLVEDEDDTADLVTLIMEGEGYQVVRAADGREAMKMIESLPPRRWCCWICCCPLPTA